VTEPLGEGPALGVIVLDFGGEIDTLQYNQVDRSSLLRSLEPRFREALDMVRVGICSKQPEWIGQGATLSALTHQRLLPKPQLDTVLCLAREVGAYGVNIAHSGTVLGLLISPDGVETVLAYVTKKIPQLQRAIPCRLVSGGCRVLSVNEWETVKSSSAFRQGVVVSTDSALG
jgi:L-threonine kinase